MEYVSEIISLTISIGIISYVMLSNEKASPENKKSNFQICSIFGVCFIVIYMLVKLIYDNNDTRQIHNNIKMGEPPF
jgi:preprotein translocase subunit SecG